MPRDRARSPRYTPRVNIPADIPADFDQSPPRRPNPPPRPLPINPPPVLPIRFHILLLEEPRPHFHILFHLRNIVTVDIRLHSYCAFVFVGGYLCYRLYLLVLSCTAFELFCLSPFLAVLIVIPLHIIVHGPVPPNTLPPAYRRY